MTSNIRPETRARIIPPELAEQFLCKAPHMMRRFVIWWK